MIALGYQPAEAKEVFEKADKDGEGSLSYEEFKQLLKHGKGMGKTEESCTVVQVP